VRIDHVDELQPGATVLVTVGTLRAVGATVVWARESSAGLKFVEHVDSDHARAKVIIPRREDAAPRMTPNSAEPTIAATGWLHNLLKPYGR